jgi:hypothetical protein
VQTAAIRIEISDPEQLKPRPRDTRVCADAMRRGFPSF